jgi:hypothetical protein
VTGPNGRTHPLRLRPWRTPGGISAEAIEQANDGDSEDGYTLRDFGDHDADRTVLLAELDARGPSRDEPCYLDTATGSAGS